MSMTVLEMRYRPKVIVINSMQIYYYFYIKIWLTKFYYKMARLK